MTTPGRRLARDLLPPALVRAVSRPAAGALRFEDGYADWAAAAAASTGYDESGILARIRAATDDVVAGRAAFERDGVTFGTYEYRWPVVGGLLLSAARNGGRLAVLDFGGSLGSTYRQYRPLLAGTEVQWGVVEQPAFVAAGREYEDGSLSFFASIDECLSAVRPDVVLLSSVLQYLADPHDTLRRLGACGAHVLIIDRTPMTDGPDDIATLQIVPPTIYDASYPAWLLSGSRLTEDLPGWDLVDEFPGIEPDMRTTGGVPFTWQGRILVRGEA